MKSAFSQPRIVRAAIALAALAISTSAAPAGAQIPINPDIIAVTLSFSDPSAPTHDLVRVVATGDLASLPAGMVQGAEYWHTLRSLLGQPLVMRSGSARDATAISRFVADSNLTLACAQEIGTAGWAAWTPQDNRRGYLYRAVDPQGLEPEIGLFLGVDASGRVISASWYRRVLLNGGVAFTAAPARLELQPVVDALDRPSTDPRDIGPGVWQFSEVLAPPAP